MNSAIQGRLDTSVNGLITGWLVGLDRDPDPLVFVNGLPAKLIEWPIDRKDVCISLNIPGLFGFSFQFDGLAPGDVVELFVFLDERFVLIDKKITQDRSGKTCVFEQMAKAKEISSLPNSVAITCWDGGHNPIGRAKALYQSVVQHRPAIIIAYQFEQFSTELWGPLKDTSIEYVLIPWGNREEYFYFFQVLNIKFSTIWMCKSRFPTFELTANLTREDTKLVLDHDDNERHFEQVTTKDYFYGANTSSLASYLSLSISAHTAASLPLAEKFKAQVVRHARSQAAQKPVEIDTHRAMKVGFVGTVRKHKGLVSAAKALKLTGWLLGLDIEFHVYGTFETYDLQSQLESYGVITSGEVMYSQLENTLAKFDIILCGFPTDTEEDKKINAFQISSKIGDALSLGIPALVPCTPGTRDLAEIPGVFLFDKSTLAEAIARIVSTSPSSRLPYEFTYQGAYEAFARAESLASTAPAAFELIRFSSAASSSADPEKTLVLLWKQNDAGLYGRRIDQVARAFKEKHPKSRVIVLEFCHTTTKSAYFDQRHEFSSDGRLIASLLDQKLNPARSLESAVEYIAISFESTSVLNSHFIRFVKQNRLAPDNTTFILFPIINFIDQIFPVLRMFKIVVDIVDNQFSWASEITKASLAKQYAQLFALASAVVFNSDENRAYFSDGGFCAQFSGQPEDLVTIPNWYQSPSNEVTHNSIEQSKTNEVGFLFSGNLNDRIDWSLVKEIAEIRPEATIHIVGNARRAREEITKISHLSNIVYWGPLPESKVRTLAGFCYAGLVPHLVNNISQFMNPMKVQMYLDLGLPVLSTELPGVDHVDGVHVFRTKAMYLKAICEIVDSKKVNGEGAKHFRNRKQRAPQSKKEYLKLLHKISS